MKTELVASVAADSTEELVRLAAHGTAGADLVELRVDGVADLDLARLRNDVDKPAILTCRSSQEGGHFSGGERERLALLREAVELGFDAVDVEIDALSRPFPKKTSRLVLSHHDFEALPETMDALLERAIDLGADIVKVAARVASLDETLSLAEMGQEARARGVGFASVPLGRHGVSGRVLANRMGSALAFAPARGGASTGPGQVGLDELLDLYRFSSLGPSTEIYGILGGRALTSLSPAMHNDFFRRIGRDAVYVPFEEDDLEAFVRAARKLGVAGLSITIPFKEAILPFLDDVHPRAREVGAVNTVVCREGRWTGYNTDVDGVTEPLRQRGDWRSRRAVVVGAGGAARAAAFALRELGASVVVLARNEQRARALADACGGTFGPLSQLDEEPWDLLLNATPVGSVALPGEAVTSEITPGSAVFEMVTVPEKTALVRRALEVGASVVTGVEMLAAQAVHQARLWTGREPDAASMRRAARAGDGSSRYSRQVLFKEIGERGQRLLRAKAVLVVGAGALGSVSSEMIVRAGVGTLRLVDRDYVDESNLQRQSLYDERDVRDGLPKAVAAQKKLAAFNSDVEIDARVEDLHAGNVVALLDGVDLVLDGTDNFETRYLLNDAAIQTGIPWIYAACVGSYGMSFVVLPGETPCLRCFMEDEPPPGTSPTCDTAGVIAPAVHAVASFQVAEALKILCGRRSELHGSVLSLDVWRGSFDTFRPAARRGDCPACGERRFDYLSGTGESQTATLCGRNAVQVRPAKRKFVELGALAERLRALGDVVVNEHLLRARLGDREVVLFRDGRAIVHGTEDPAEAKTLYARYVGN